MIIVPENISEKNLADRVVIDVNQNKFPKETEFKISTLKDSFEVDGNGIVSAKVNSTSLSVNEFNETDRIEYLKGNRSLGSDPSSLHEKLSRPHNYSLNPR